ncbi:MAG: 2-succinyl-5-enolpyruvyl-6-hydroxy-3-cyclohexene-1-carboxylic-acid synthase [Chitinophagales bacterium]|nr:2-succinyl-5-enolpyruvyl-6-hydroxy-3-cyclohexene-1-carboxylic-acid synthase [Chitinophagales bacterium]
MNHSDKLHIQYLVFVLKQLGLDHVVLSPGSRSAPLVQEFACYPEIKKHVLFDERSAGYFALGLAQQIRKPVAVFCTSGTAVLNLAPAICEAYHQKIPLIILTADRPSEAMGKGENQTINQIDIYKNYIKAFYNLAEGEALQQEQLVQTIVNSISLHFGPVHINLPLREPLYNTATASIFELPIVEIPTSPTLSKDDKAEISSAWKNANRKMIVCGMDHFQTAKLSWLKLIQAQEDVILLHEPIANVALPDSIYNIDGTIASIKEIETYQPDVVITIGRQFTSKRLRNFIKTNTSVTHWHISIENEQWDSFNRLQKVWNCTDSEFLKVIAAVKTETSDWKKQWLSIQPNATVFDNTTLTDFSVYQALAKAVPNDCIIQWGNSAPIRYSGLLHFVASIEHFANRGTSGIDGCVSTAVGCAIANPDKQVFLFVGDLSFFYDSNALFYSPFPANLRIVIVNNSGGNIFRLIEGQKEETLMQNYFEVQHQHSAKALAEQFSMHYFSCEKNEELEKTIERFFGYNNCCILELKTDATSSVDTYKNYFKR